MSALTRRACLKSALACGGAAVLSGAAAQRPSAAAEARVSTGREHFRISLNTSTLRGHKLTITQIVDIAVRTGYGGIEPWPDDLERHIASGGSLRDLAKRLKDNGLAVTGAIHFAQWMVDDAAERARALEEVRRMMDRLAQIGGTHMAAPPRGEVKNVDLLAAAERYRALLELSEGFGVTPAVELWGFAANLYRLGQIAYVAIEADHPRACILPDVYHLVRGGSGLGGIGRLHGSLYAGFHLNDLPADHPPREKLTDADRIYPGDGVLPLAQLLRDLRGVGYAGPVSIELFNPTYYSQDPEHVARTALHKTRTVMAAAFRSS